LATQGSRFFILNGPEGGLIEQLPQFPYYATIDPPFPGGWLDNQTGDLYCYDENDRSWIPSCNVGLRRLPITGTVDNNITKNPHRNFNYRQRIKNISKGPEVIERTEEYCYIENHYIQHPFVHNFEHQEFIATPTRRWHINEESRLSIDKTKFHILASTSTKGPIIIDYNQHAIMVSLDLCHRRSREVIDQLIGNFISQMLDNFHHSYGLINTSLYTYVFGIHGEGNGEYNKYTETSIRYAPSLGSHKIKCSLKSRQGPKYVDINALKSLFLLHDNIEDEDYEIVIGGGFDGKMRRNSLVTPRPSSTMGRKSIHKLKLPQEKIKNRLDKILDKSCVDVYDSIRRETYDFKQLQEDDDEQTHRDVSFQNSFNSMELIDNMNNVNTFTEDILPTYLTRASTQSYDTTNKISRPKSANTSVEALHNLTTSFNSNFLKQNENEIFLKRNNSSLINNYLISKTNTASTTLEMNPIWKNYHMESHDIIISPTKPQQPIKTTRKTHQRSLSAGIKKSSDFSGTVYPPKSFEISSSKLSITQEQKNHFLPRNRCVMKPYEIQQIDYKANDPDEKSFRNPASKYFNDPYCYPEELNDEDIQKLHNAKIIPLDHLGTGFKTATKVKRINSARKRS
jgi:hypothetical protein